MVQWCLYVYSSVWQFLVEINRQVHMSISAYDFCSLKKGYKNKKKSSQRCHLLSYVGDHVVWFLNLSLPTLFSNVVVSSITKHNISIYYFLVRLMLHNFLAQWQWHSHLTSTWDFNLLNKQTIFWLRLNVKLLASSHGKSWIVRPIRIF